jgi:hypothetical protein
MTYLPLNGADVVLRIRTESTEMEPAAIATTVRPVAAWYPRLWRASTR